MLLGLYGGTFDPVHVGHVHAAVSVCESLGLEQVRMVLAARPGHRGTPGENTQHRWAMLQLACSEYGQLVPDDTELHRPGKSYTIDTLSEICRKDPTAIPCWILGQDAFATLPIWHRWQELLDFCNLVVIDRPGDRREEPVEVRNLYQQHEVKGFNKLAKGQVVRLNEPMQEVSATDIRHRISNAEAVEDLLAPAVYTYIRQHRLYQRTENTF